MKLAIVRHDLARDEFGLSSNEAEEIAADTWHALNGLDTCAKGKAKELQAAFDLFKEVS